MAQRLVADRASVAIMRVERVVGSPVMNFGSSRGLADQPENVQMLRNCCWHGAGKSFENTRSILSPLATPRTTPRITP